MNEATKPADVSIDKQTQAEIFKLKMDHFEELFDWLSLKELSMLSKTCQRMQHIVGYYIKTNYAAIKFKFTNDGVRTVNNLSINAINLDGWSSFLKKLVIPYLENVPYDRWDPKWMKPTNIFIPHMKADQFKSLTEIQLNEPVFTDEGIFRIKEILSQLETVKLYIPRYLQKSEFYSSFLQYCTSVKRLCLQVDYCDSVIGTDYGWLQRKYPTLEHFQFISAAKIKELKIFFEQNSHIKTFATSIDLIEANKNIFRNVKFDVLSIERRYYKFYDSPVSSLNKLYECGLFKELHVYFVFRDLTNYETAIDGMTSFNGLTKLFIDGLEYDTHLPPLVHLSHLGIDNASRVSNMKTTAEKLVNLKVIQFTHAKIDDILPFVRYSPKLTKILIFRLYKNVNENTESVNGFSTAYENNENILEIDKLNEQRSKLTNARKITIYVEEDVYLAVKWSKNQTSTRLIEIKRRESYDTLDHCFDF